MCSDEKIEISPFQAPKGLFIKKSGELGLKDIFYPRAGN